LTNFGVAGAELGKLLESVLGGPWKQQKRLSLDAQFDELPLQPPSLSPYLRYVDRFSQAINLVKHICQQHELVTREPKFELEKDVRFATAYGAPGGGKSSFPRKAEIELLRVCRSNPAELQQLPEFALLESCREHVAFPEIEAAIEQRRQYAISLGSGVTQNELSNPSLSIALRLLFEHCKYQILPSFSPDGDSSTLESRFHQFCTKLLPAVPHEKPLRLGSVLQFIAQCDSRAPRPSSVPVVLINLDDTNEMVKNDSAKTVKDNAPTAQFRYLQAVLRDFIAVMQSGKILPFLILTGTHAEQLRLLISTSGPGTNFVNYNMSLLTVDHAGDVITDLVERAKRAVTAGCASYVYLYHACPPLYSRPV
jgi:hypothetical protein